MFWGFADSPSDLVCSARRTADHACRVALWRRHVYRQDDGHLSHHYRLGTLRLFPVTTQEVGSSSYIDIVEGQGSGGGAAERKPCLIRSS